MHPAERALDAPRRAAQYCGARCIPLTLAVLATSIGLFTQYVLELIPLSAGFRKQGTGAFAD